MLIDFFLLEMLDTIEAYDASAFNELPNLKALHATLNAIPQISAYKASNRFVAKPFFAPNMANWSGM